MLPNTRVCDSDVRERVRGGIRRRENGKQEVLGPHPTVIELPRLLERAVLSSEQTLHSGCQLTNRPCDLCVAFP